MSHQVALQIGQLTLRRDAHVLQAVHFFVERARRWQHDGTFTRWRLELRGQRRTAVMFFSTGRRTLDLYVTLKRNHPAIGVALQAYLRRTPEDLARLMPLNPVIRLVKGAYDERRGVAFEKKSDTDRAYYSLAVRMLDGAHSGVCSPVLGTHDLALIARITEQAEASGVGKDKYQIHMLYGIRDSAQRRLTRTMT